MLPNLLTNTTNVYKKKEDEIIAKTVSRLENAKRDMRTLREVQGLRLALTKWDDLKTKFENGETVYANNIFILGNPLNWQNAPEDGYYEFTNPEHVEEVTQAYTLGKASLQKKTRYYSYLVASKKS